MAEDSKMTIMIDGTKPHLRKLLAKDKEKAKEVISTFVEMMEHACQYGWADLPEQFHPDLKFKSMVHDILHGLLDLKNIDPKNYGTLGVMVHPLGLLGYQVPDFTQPEGYNYYDWQSHFAKSKGDLPDIQSLLRKLMYYSRYIKIEELGEAMFRKEMDLYLVERDPTPLIASHPALLYQKKNLGDRFAGKLNDMYGVLDCGDWPEGATDCPACQVGVMKQLPGVKACKKCGAGFRTEEVDS